jgi:hypothetical protein
VPKMERKRKMEKTSDHKSDKKKVASNNTTGKRDNEKRRGKLKAA